MLIGMSQDTLVIGLSRRNIEHMVMREQPLFRPDMHMVIRAALGSKDPGREFKLPARLLIFVEETEEACLERLRSVGAMSTDCAMYVEPPLGERSPS